MTNRLKITILSIGFLGVLAGLYIVLNTKKKANPNFFIDSDTTIVRPATLPVEIPDTASFAGERVPLEYFDVRESLDRELTSCTYWHTQTLLIIKKSQRFFSIIEPILASNGVPDDFKYLAITESNLVPTAISPSRAVGLWQILEDTGKELRLEINDEVDERYHVEKSTQAACAYLKRIYDRTGSWTLAAASYNSGPTGLRRQIERQGENSYYNLLLNDETARYVFRTLAFKIILTNPQTYGFMVREDDIYPLYAYKEVRVDSSITNMGQFARYFDTNYKMLKMLNPWLREAYLHNKQHKKYIIKVPTNR